MVYRCTVRREYFVGLEILGQPLYHLLGIGLEDMREASMLGGDKMLDEGEGVLHFGNDGIFIVLVGKVVACWYIGTTHADAIECQCEDVATLAGSDGK